MAKKKAKVVYRYRTKKRKMNKKGSSGFLNMSKLGKPLGAMGYGLVREKISDFIANSSVGRKLPISQFTDEAVMLATMYGARKFGLSKGVMGSVIRNGESVEWARIGQTLGDLYVTRGNISAVAGGVKELF